MNSGREPSIGGDQRIAISGEEPKLGGEAAILHLVEMLHHDDRKVRYRAALKLVELGDQRVFDTLVEMLRDQEGTRRLRERAAMALGQLGDERAVEPLVAALGTIDSFCAVKAIIEIGGARAIAAVEALMFSHWGDDGVYHAIRKILPETSDQRVIDFLVTAVENTTTSRPRPNSLAAAVLGKMGSRVIEPLLPLLNHESEHVRFRALTALSGLQDERLIELFIARLDDDYLPVVRDAVQWLRKAGSSQAVPPLINILNHPDLHIAELAAGALGEIGDARAVDPLLKALDSPHERIRLSAVIALGKIGDPRVVEALSEVLLEQEIGLVIYAARALAAIGTDEALQVLFTAIWECQMVDGYEAASIALGGIENPRVPDLLVRLLLHHPHTGARWGAIDMLKNFADDPHLIEVLIQALLDQEQAGHIRGKVADSLGEIGDPQAVEPLIAALHDSYSGSRARAAESLGELGDSRAVEPLIQVLHDDLDEHAYVSEYAAKALGKLADRRAVDPLIAAVANREVPFRVAAAAIDALGRLGDRRAVEPLIGMMLNNFGGNGCWSAAEALGRLGDERAVEHLISVLYRADQRISDCLENGDNDRLDYYEWLVKACKTALRRIGTPEALAAVEDLPFRDLGD